MNISTATDPRAWDQFLLSQPYRPFLQSWAMGEVYRRIGQEPIRLIMKEGETVRGICFAHVVPARRGRHLSIPYGPLLEECGMGNVEDGMRELLRELTRVAKEKNCSFIRMSPFWKKSSAVDAAMQKMHAKASPLHLLAEHLWLLPLENTSEDEILKNMRSTTRNLIRRAEKEGVIVTASDNPVRDLPLFLKLHEETRKRHGFTPYTDAFFRAQIEEFAKTDNVMLYIARHQGDVLATSIHMTFGGETSYHHGASVISKIPASTLLQWTAIKDALKRGDHLYNFWGIAPVQHARHPFGGVTLFKTGFGGTLLELTHCRDIPLSPTYYLTRSFEGIRKWRRGF